MGLLAGKSWVAGLKASFASQRLAMLGVNTANMTTAQMAAAFKGQSAVARLGSAIAVGLRSALSVAMMTRLRRRINDFFDVRDGGGQCSGSPKPSGGRIVIASSLLAAEDLPHHC